MAECTSGLTVVPEVIAFAIGPRYSQVVLARRGRVSRFDAGGTMRKYLLLALAVALLWPAAVNAQSSRDRSRGRTDDRGERIARIIRDCEQRTNEFKQAVDRSWGRGERRNNDELDRNAAQMERALNRVRDAWNRDRDYQRTRGSVGAAITAGKAVSRTLGRHRLSSRVTREWDAIKTELNNLAEIFEQPRIRW
jgi:hypothetical protein